MVWVVVYIEYDLVLIVGIVLYGNVELFLGWVLVVVVSGDLICDDFCFCVVFIDDFYMGFVVLVDDVDYVGGIEKLVWIVVGDGFV